MRATPRKDIRNFITANGASTAETIIADGVAKGSPNWKMQQIIDRQTAKGKLIKTGDDYSFPV